MSGPIYVLSFTCYLITRWNKVNLDFFILFFFLQINVHVSKVCLLYMYISFDAHTYRSMGIRIICVLVLYLYMYIVSSGE